MALVAAQTRGCEVGYASLSKVVAGWTGTVAVTYGGITTTITPRLRESVASIFVRLAHEVYRDSGLALSIGIDSNPIVRASASAPFDMTTSGNLATRSGLSDLTYSGAASYEGPDDAQNEETAFFGARLVGPILAGDIGSATGAGGYGYAPMPALGKTQLRWWTIYAHTWSDEQISGVYDFWQDGRIFGRIRIDGWRRVPMGLLRSTGIELVADVQAVTE